MPYIFVDDGGPDPYDYADNYIWFNSRVPGSLKEALQLAQGRRESGRVSRPQRMAGPRPRVATFAKTQELVQRTVPMSS